MYDLSLCLISSLRNILFVTLGLVLLLFHSQFLLLSLPSKARGTRLTIIIIIIIIIILFLPIGNQVAVCR